MLRTERILGLAALVFAAACAPLAPGADSRLVPNSDEPRWIQGPEPGIRTLLMPPSVVTSLNDRRHGDVDLSVGAFYARWERDGARMEQLALLFQLEGHDRAFLESLAEDLRLIMDGALYRGAAGSGANGRFLEPVDGRHRLSVAIPVCVETLEIFIEASAVQAQLGPSPVFRLPPGDRQRLRSILEQVPAGPRTFVSALSLLDDE